ncbi:hypothetical protein [Vibrio owensii]|uniref:hypothetical protein n=1 Tax=Vibrio owensii TaxID=696485 RepID=UPI00039FEC6D|nr:hypothetical protein [Vibrio owensii]
MKKLSKFVFALVFGISIPVNSATLIKATATTQSVTWDNGSASRGYVQTLAAQPVNQLPNTARWTPGLNPTNKNLTLSNGSGNTVTLTLDAVGLEYDFGGNSPSYSANPLSSQISCAVERKQGTKVLLLNDSSSACFFSERISYSSLTQPFFYVKPTIGISDTTIVNAFKNKSSGIYRGTIPISYRYAYTNPSGMITYRNMTTSVVVSIVYQPNDITNVVVTPSTLTLTPNYDRAKQQIDAEEHVEITVSGELSAGINVHLPQVDYALKNGNEQIPLTITCTDCNPSTLVNDGARLVEKTFVNASGQSTSFEFDIGYRGINYEDVLNGTYSNHFTFIIEAVF